MYFAGGESMVNLLAKYEAKHVLTSYYYLREKSEKTLDKVLNSFPDVFLDSGAFTLNLQLAREGIDWGEVGKDPRIKEYIEEYARFIDKHGHRFTIHAEIDVGPWEQKARQREFLSQYSDRLLPVIHPTDPPEYQHYLMKNNDYVALGGVGSAKGMAEIKAYVTRKVQLGRKYNCRFHGFAITIIEMMRLMPFASVDSTSWLMGSKYGMTFWFDGKTLRSYDKFGKGVRRRFKREVMELGLDWDRFIGDKAAEVNKWNLLQWMQYEEYLSLDNGRGLAKFKAQQENFFRKTEGSNLKGYNEFHNH